MDIQQRLDESGRLVVRGPVQPPNAPIFLDSGYWLSGEDSTSLVDLFSSGGFVTGWRRGLISDAHFTNGGLFRTFGDSWLFSRGMHWDLGPSGGWPSVTKLRIVASFTKHYSLEWRQVLAGISGLDRTAAGSYGSNPCPWVMYVLDDLVKVDYRLTNNTLHQFTVPIDGAASTISVDITLDLVALHGTGSALQDNTCWPFGIGRAPAYFGSGYWGGAGYGWSDPNPADITINQFDLHLNGSASPTFKLWGGRKQTYPGGPSIPAIEASPGRYLLVGHVSQGEQDTANGVRISDLAITGAAGCPVLSIGAGLGLDLLVSRIKADGGTRFLQTTGMFVAYHMAVRDCTLSFQTDCAFWMQFASGMTIDGVEMKYQARACGEFVECRGWVRGESMLAPPGATPQKAVFVQQGGNMQYDRIVSDYEWLPGPEAFLVAKPWAHGNQFPMRSFLNGCGFGVEGISDFVVKQRPPWADPPLPYLIVVDGVPSSG